MNVTSFPTSEVCTKPGTVQVAVGVVGGDAAELVAGEFGGLAVVVGGLFPGGGAGERPEF
jgi:hypothetical protein